MKGLKRAILYGFKPHDLGFCGPEKKATGLLLNFVLGKNVPEKKVRKIMKEFKGAFDYYQLIANANKIKDPFDDRVVEAYWLGNELLDRVKLGDLKKMVETQFSKPGLLPAKIAQAKARAIPRGSAPHHSFHVLIIGSVTGRVVLNGKLLDICRVGWGRIERLSVVSHQSLVIVSYRPLAGKKKLKLGKLVKKEISWQKELVPDLKVGDFVSFHWNQICEVLTPRQVKNLEKYTKKILAALN